MRDISVSLTLLNVSATWSACSLIWSAICVSLSKSPFGSSDRNWPTRPSRSSATFSTSFSDAIRSSFSRVSQQAPERAEVEIQVLVTEPELRLQLVHAFGELHERFPEPLDLVVVERPALHPVQRLSLHQLSQELDECQHELGEPALHRFRVGRHAPWNRPRRRHDISLRGKNACHAAPAKLAGGQGPVQTRLRS